MRITKSLKEGVNKFLNYELLTEEDVGRDLRSPHSGSGVVEIPYGQMDGKHLDSDGNIASYHQTTSELIGHIAPEKAKLILATLFPEEVKDPHFLSSHLYEIASFRNTLGTLPEKSFHWSHHAVRYEGAAEHTERHEWPYGMKFWRY